MGKTATAPRIIVRVFGAVLAAAAGVGPALAQDGGVLDSALEFMNLKAATGPMPDFVQQSRRDLSHDSYMPVGQKPVSRDVKAKTPAEVKALTAELDNARAAQLAGKRPARPFARAAGPTKPGKPLSLMSPAATATEH